MKDQGDDLPDAWGGMGQGLRPLQGPSKEPGSLSSNPFPSVLTTLHSLLGSHLRRGPLRLTEAT